MSRAEILTDKQKAFIASLSATSEAHSAEMLNVASQINENPELLAGLLALSRSVRADKPIDRKFMGEDLNIKDYDDTFKAVLQLHGMNMSPEQQKVAEGYIYLRTEYPNLQPTVESFKQLVTDGAAKYLDTMTAAASGDKVASDRVLDEKERLKRIVVAGKTDTGPASVALVEAFNSARSGRGRS